MRAVKQAETEFLRLQASRSYLGAEGDTRFTALLATVALGKIIGKPAIMAFERLPRANNQKPNVCF